METIVRFLNDAKTFYLAMVEGDQPRVRPMGFVMANALRNIAATRRKLIAGENVQSGFKEFTLSERGKIRRIKSVHISERIVQKCLCNYCLTPILTQPLIHDNGASIKGKGVHFALRRLIVRLSKFYSALA